MRTWKKALALVLALSMVIPGVALGGSEGKEVQAAAEPAKDGNYVTLEYDDVDIPEVPEGSTEKPVPTPKEEYSQYKGWLFAGWFDSRECSQDTSATGETGKYAKFVPADMLSVKAQSTQGTVKDEDKNLNDKCVLRFVSSVDNLDYSRVGFELRSSEDNFAKAKTNSTDTVYQKIASSTQGANYDFSPKVMDPKSEYFITAKWGVDAGDTNTYRVRAFWKTLDGTTVYGESREVSLNATAENAGYISVTFETEKTVTGTLAIDGYEGARIKVDETTGTTVYAQVPGSKNTLKSATYLELKENGETVASTIYRNLYTKYTPSDVNYNAEAADASWYTVYKTVYEEKGVTEGREYVIASTADLYALPYLVNTVGETFDGDTIYVVADIVANTGTAAINGWTKESDQTEYRWIPVGDNSSNPFKGTFDGCGHTISGLFTNSNHYYNGFFGWVYDAVFQNFSLTNSLFKSTNITNSGTNPTAMGSIAAGGDATFKNIHSSANLSSTAFHLGGIIGRVTADSKAATVCKIENCWFDGTINSRATSGNVRAGGLMGYVVHGNNSIENSLFTGTIRMDGGTYFGGIYADSNPKSQSEIAISDCLSAGAMKINNTASATSNVGSVAGRINGDAVATEDGPIYATTECHSTDVGTTGSGATATVEQVAQKNLNGMSAVYYMPEFDFENDWALQSGGVPVPKTLATESLTPNRIKEADTSWYNADAPAGTTFPIADAADLYGLMKLVNGGTDFAGMTIQLTKDIDLNPEYELNLQVIDGVVSAPSTDGVDMWIPIGYEDAPFSGTFDGNGKTISGMYINKQAAWNDGKAIGLFGFVYNAEITDLKLTDSYMYVNALEAIGSVVGWSTGDTTLEEVYSDVGIYGVNTTGNGIAGLIGYINYSDSNKVNPTCNILNSAYAGTLVLRTGNTTVKNCGGMVGYALRGTLNIKHSLFEGIIDYKNTGTTSGVATADINISGFLARDNGTTTKITIEDCLSAGKINIVCADENLTITTVGSILGRRSGSPTINNVYAIEECWKVPVVSSAGAAETNYGTTYSLEQVTAGEADFSGLSLEYWTIESGKLPIHKYGSSVQ